MADKITIQLTHEQLRALEYLAGEGHEYLEYWQDDHHLGDPVAQSNLEQSLSVGWQALAVLREAL